ncbi:MAG: hypothetical protein H8E27_12220 [Verrucomicrobia subdivision 3 bacterium]|nr:hypothetical protein [Limisphaerales bacterium]
MNRFRHWAVFLLIAGVVGVTTAAESSLANQALNSVWDAVKGFGELALKAVWHCTLWGGLGFVVGVAAGVFLWRALRDRGWMDIPWGGYKYVRWLWPVLMVGTLSLGSSSWLGIWGGGRAIKQGARQGEVFEKAVVNTYSAIMVWRLAGLATDANGTSLLERDLGQAITLLRKTASQAQSKERAVRERALVVVEQKTNGNFFENWFTEKAIEFIWDEQLKGNLTDTEAAKVIGSFQADGVSESEAVALAKNKIMGGVHLALDGWVDSMIHPILATIFVIALGLLLGPLGAFWFIRWLCLRGKKEPPLLNADSN